MPRGKRNVTVSTTPDVVDKTVTTVSSDTAQTNKTTRVVTKEQSERTTEPTIEKSRDAEKNSAPVVLISWTDTGGKRHTRTYTCAEVRVNEDKSETLQRSGKKTTLGMTLEAQVLEVDHR